MSLENLFQRFLLISCHIYNSISHIFLRCNFARAVWFGLPFSVLSDAQGGQLQRWLLGWIRRWKRDRERFESSWFAILVGLDLIWKYRNEVVWKGTRVHPSTVIRSVLFSVSFYDSVFNQVQGPRGFSGGSRTVVFNPFADVASSSLNQAIPILDGYAENSRDLDS